jgi:murein DD-endopeptidase MepM/ murein hydrolase activator NlpD
MRALRLPVLLAVLGLLVITAPFAGAKKGGSPWRFPMNGEHDFGELGDTGFGKKRPDGSHHTGQDILADCGTPLVATHLSEVRSKGYEDGTGFYLVLHGLGTKFDFVYAHMKGRARVKKGAKVKAGRRLGSVGHSGTASGICHLHFELWSGKWFGGGRRVDPLPRLRKWDQTSGGPIAPGPTPSAAFVSAAD